MSDDLKKVRLFEELRLLCESLEDDLSDAILIIDRHADCIEELEAKLAKAVSASVDTAASLVAAISLLEKGGKKAAPSNKMFDQMMADYRASLERTRTTLAELKGEQY